MSELMRQLVELLKQLRPWITIAPWEHGVRTRAGRHACLLKPGLHFAIPLLDYVIVRNVRRRAINIPLQTVTTRDGACVSIAGGLAYEVEDLLKVYHHLYGVDDALTQEAHAAIAFELEHRTVNELSPIDLAAAVERQLSARLKECGITGFRVFISDMVRVKTYRLIADQRYSTISNNLHLDGAA